ncbi:MAG: SpoIIE family protein phosphatase [Armatimonadetes bacterium]|nr:SpoIIE family protein phosphatase [Armatimonadota bacterium]
MSNPNSNTGDLLSQVKSPWWVGYLVTIVAEAGLTLGLVVLEPHLPLGKFPIPYVVLVMAIAYFFGTCPALLAFVAGFFMYDYFFVPPEHTILPHTLTPEGWAGTVAFFLGMLIVGSATLLMRRSWRRIQRLNEELVAAKELAEQRRAQVERESALLQASYEREHKIAETLQESLLLPVPRQIDSFAFETTYRAASDEASVGGDFYDVFRIDDTRVGIVIGDVSGKGLSAAIQVAAIKYAIRGRAYESPSPEVVMGQVNKTVLRDLDADSFITVFLGVLDSEERTLIYANAGHSPVFLWRHAELGATMLASTGIPVGIWDNATYEEFIVRLRHGDELLLGTDGLYEVRCGAGLLEIDGLLNIWSEIRKTGHFIPTVLVDRIIDVCRGGLRDDVAILHISLVN